MASNTLNNRSSGETITAAFFNDIHNALDGDIVGRGATGVPEAGKALGTVAIPFGTVRANSIVVSGQAIDPTLASIPQNVIISGAKRSSSNQPQFLDPSGAGLSLTVIGTATSLVYDVNGTEVTLSADVVKSSLTAAPSSNNTALVNDVDAADQVDTRLWGEEVHRKTITIDTVGSEISALVGKYASFKIVGVATEYFYAFVKSATELTQCMRGYYFDPSGNPIKRTEFSNNDTITLMKTGYLFAENNGTTIDVSYNNPTWSFDSPAGPVTGDYWYDLQNLTWKRYDGAAFQIINRTFIGQFITDTTDCVGARSADFYSRYDDQLEMGLELTSTEIARATKPGSKVSVYGNTIYFGSVGRPSWNITTDLAGSSDMQIASEQASTVYYLYVKDTGETVLSDVFPYDRQDLCGWYHPHNPWRCVGHSFNDGSSNLVVVSSVDPRSTATMKVDGNAGIGSTNGAVQRWTNVQSVGEFIYTDSATLGASFLCVWPGVYSFNHTNGSSAGSVFFYVAVNSADLTNVPTISERLASTETPGIDKYGYVSGTAYLKVGDSLGIQGAGNAAATDPTPAMAMAKRVS